MRPNSDLDETLVAVAHPQRRRVLFARFDHPEGVDSHDLSGDGAPEGGRADRRRVALRHDHLPRLSERGFVDWDRDDGTLRRGPRFDEVRPLLELLAKRSSDLPDGRIGDAEDRQRADD
jgi:hypothetical protein